MKPAERPEPTSSRTNDPSGEVPPCPPSPPKEVEQDPRPLRRLPLEVDRLYVGIDVAQETLEVTVLDGLGNVVASSTSYPNTPEGHDELWSDTQALCHRLHLPIAYAMEASGIYHVDLLYFLVEQRADVWSFNPLLLKEEKGGSLRKTKTDPIDARRIAEYARTKGHKRPFATWNETDKRLRERCRIRHRIVEKASDSQRQLHRDLDLLVPGLTGTLGRLDHPSSLAACLAIFQQTKFPEVSQEEVERALKPFYTRTELVAPKAQRIAERLQACRPAGGMVEPLIDEVKFLVREIELFQEQIRQEEGRIAREMETRDSRLLTVPGVGPVVAAVVASELGDPQRFSRVEEVVAFAGLDSSKKLSGKFEGRFTPISKRGPPAIRESVYNAAMVASRVEPVSKEFFERLRGKGKAYKVAMVALARRILIWCWVVLRDGVAWDANRARPHAQRVKDLGKSQPA